MLIFDIKIEILEKTLAGRQKNAEKVERGIKTARVCDARLCLFLAFTHRTSQDNWKPALEKLVGSIGTKFSAAFDRERHSHRLLRRSNLFHRDWLRRRNQDKRE
jgi:hypothetical protein